ncbi:MAG: IS1380 family transposase [Armatimonadetes bacterium]|nr:IS1380 family transposase [Armatimonadota bacterium]
MFTRNHLTRFGGVFLLHRFFQRLRLRRRFHGDVDFPQRNNTYTIPEMLLALLYPIILGLGRVETTELLRRNGVFQALTGLPAYPDPTTLRRFLRRFALRGVPKLRRLHDRLLARICQRPRPLRRVLLDLDSTVLTLYGHQEKARLGYNPRQRGRPSYHPLVCFEGQTKDFWHGELRPGDAYTATGTVWLLQACFRKLPATVRQIRVRADAGFFDYKVVRAVEASKGKFVIVARLTSPLKRLIPGLPYTEVRSGLAVAECQYQPPGWPHPYRFVVVRKPLPEEESAQTTLFTMGRYSYHAFVTNLRIWPLAVYRFYNDRAAVENIIKELKADYPLAKIPTGQFAANEAYFHLLLFAYNLVNWYKRLCLPAEYHAMTLGTLRRRLLMLPGEFVRPKQIPTLRLPASLEQDAIIHALNRIDRLKT